MNAREPLPPITIAVWVSQGLVAGVRTDYAGPIDCFVADTDTEGSPEREPDAAELYARFDALPFDAERSE